MTGYPFNPERQLHFVIGVVFAYSLISTYGSIEQRDCSRISIQRTRVSRRTRLRQVRPKRERLAQSRDDQGGLLLAKKAGDISWRGLVQEILDFTQCVIKTIREVLQFVQRRIQQVQERQDQVTSAVLTEKQVPMAITPSYESLPFSGAGIGTHPYRHHAFMMPPRGTPGAPFFGGKNITEFIRQFDDLCDDYDVPRDQKVRRVLRFCSTEIEEYLRTEPIFTELDWEKAKTFMLEEWEKNDDDQRKRTLAFLEALKSKPRTGKDDLKAYCRQYKVSSNWLVQLGQLSQYHQALWFVQGLPEFMMKKVVQKSRMNPKEPKTMDFEKLCTLVLEMVKTEEALSEITQDRVSLEKASELVDKSQNKPAVTELPVVTIPAFTPSPATAKAQVDPMDELTQKMSALLMPVAAAITRLDQRVASNDVQKPQNQMFERKRTGIQTIKCYFCGEQGHFRDRCPKYQAMMASGDIHQNAEGTICLGSQGTGGLPVAFPRDGTLGIDYVREMLQKAKPRVQSIRVGASPDWASLEEDTDDEEEINVLVGVQAARNTPNIAQGTSQRVWQTKKDRETALPSPKTSRAGEYGRKPAPQQRDRKDYGDVDMVDLVDDAAGTKKVTFQEPTERSATRRRLGDVLRAESRPELLVKSILDQKLDVSIRDLIGVSPDVSKLIFRSSTWEEPSAEEAQKAQVRVNVAQEYRETARPLDGGAVVAGCPKVAVSIGGMETVALVDSGAQINAMHLGLARKIGLPISTQGGISAVSYTGEMSEFYGIVRNVEVSIGEATIVTHILVSKDQDPENPLILGRPFHKNARLSMWDDEDGACYGRVRDMETGNEVEFRAAGIEHAEEEGRTQRARGARSLNL
jgi:hypothetical protein